MGYNTNFSGSFDLDEPLTKEQIAYLTEFSRTRRMKRDLECIEKINDLLRLAVGLQIGIDGGYYVASDTDDSSVINYNHPPEGQPGFYCQWIPSEDGTYISWDGGENFSEYVEWIEYIIEHFLKPWGKILNGGVEWEGNSSDDLGKIVIKNNLVESKIGRIVYE